MFGDVYALWRNISLVAALCRILQSLLFSSNSSLLMLVLYLQQLSYAALPISQ